jgi:hypothetical protein
MGTFQFNESALCAGGIGLEIFSQFESVRKFGGPRLTLENPFVIKTPHA